MEATTWLQLPEPDRTTLSAAPLELVVLQIKFERKAPIPPQTALTLKAELGNGTYPHLEQAVSSEVVFQMSPGGPSTSETRVEGWRFVSHDRRWVVGIFPDSASIECTGYTDWDEFEERANALIRTIAGQLSPELVYRVGLRYIDRIMLPDLKIPSDWIGLAASEVLGFAASPNIGGQVASVKTETAFDMGSVKGVIRTSCGPDNQGPTRHSMVIDTDCFEESAFSFATTSLAQKLEKLHDVALQLFQLVATPQLRKRLNP